MGDSLLIVAIKTDQLDIQRRMSLILAAAEPQHRPPDTQPCVFAKAVDELVADDFDRLAHFIGEANVRRLNIGDVVKESTPT